MLGAIILILVALFFYLLPAVPLSLPAWYFGRRRTRFRWWELSVFIMPLAIWLILFLVSTEKSAFGAAHSGEPLAHRPTVQKY